jgi:hypothetical protein
MARNTQSESEARRMHQTTLRFAPDLWETVSREAVSTGVSVAQYVREAVLIRIVYEAGQRGDPLVESAMRLVGVDVAAPSRLSSDGAARWAHSERTRIRVREDAPRDEPA